MGLFEKIFGGGKRPPQSGGEYFKTFTAYQPVFHSWQGELYESELVRAAVDARARHISKLIPSFGGSAQPSMRAKLKKQPNGFQTWSQFLYRTSTILDMQGTCFIVPVRDEYGFVTGIYPLLPQQCEVVQYAGDPWLRYTFQNGEKAAVPMRECGVLTSHQYKDDFFGEDNRALRDTMNLMSIQTQAINEAVRNSNSFRFMAQLSNFAKPEDLSAERKRFTEQNLREDGTGGLLLFPNTYGNIQQIRNQSYVVDTAQLEMIRTNVYNYFGVNEDVLQNRANGDQLDAFFNGCVEMFSVQFSDVITRMLFTDNERAHGSLFMLISNRLQYMSTTAKISMARELGDRGVLMIDEIRELFNYEPLPDGAGQHAPIRGEYKDAGDLSDGGNENGDS